MAKILTNEEVIVLGKMWIRSGKSLVLFSKDIDIRYATLYERLKKLGFNVGFRRKKR